MPAKPLEPDAVIIATLAAQLLPKLELPKEWQNMDGAAISLEFKKLLRPSHDASHSSPFALLAEAAVIGANILLDAARRLDPQEKAAVRPTLSISPSLKAVMNPHTPEHVRREIREKFQEEENLEIEKMFRKIFPQKALTSPPSLDDVLIMVVKGNNPRTTPSVIKAFTTHFRKEHAATLKDNNLVMLHLQATIHWLVHRKMYSKTLQTAGGKAGYRNGRGKELKESPSVLTKTDSKRLVTADKKAAKIIKKIK